MTWWKSNGAACGPAVEAAINPTFLVGRGMAALVVGRVHQNVELQASVWDREETLSVARAGSFLEPGDRRGIPSVKIEGRRYFHLVDLLEYVRARDGLSFTQLEEYVHDLRGFCSSGDHAKLVNALEYVGVPG